MHERVSLKRSEKLARRLHWKRRQAEEQDLVICVWRPLIEASKTLFSRVGMVGFLLEEILAKARVHCKLAGRAVRTSK